MPHLHSIYDTDSHFEIDPIQRKIINLTNIKKALIQHDHNSEKFTFELPRYIAGHDMSLCDKIEVHYINVGTNKADKSEGVYPVDDVQISPDDDSVVIFSWLISGNATRFAGTLNFLISFKCLTGETIDYAWHTEIYKSITVSEGMDNGEAVIAEYSDVLEAWKAEIINSIANEVKGEVNNLETQVNALNLEVESLKALTFTLHGAETEEAYDSRETAGGLPILDGHKARITKIDGDVVPMFESLWSPTITGLSSVSADGANSSEVVLGEKYTLRKIEGANPIVDEINFEKKQFIKRIDSVILPDLTWEKVRVWKPDGFDYPYGEFRAKLPYRNGTDDAISSPCQSNVDEQFYQFTPEKIVKGDYIYLTWDGGWSGVDEEAMTVDGFMEQLNQYGLYPFMCYYEMSEPEITDIDVDGSYTAYKGGTETVTGNENANIQIYEATYHIYPTLTQEYYLSMGG